MHNDEAPTPKNLGDPGELATFVNRVLRVSEPAQRRAQIERFLRTVDEDTSAAHLDRLLRQCALGDSASLEVILSLAEMLGDLRPNTDLRVEALDLLARQHELTALAWFLLEPPAQQALPSKSQAAARDIAPLGVRRAEAAGWRADRLERLLQDQDPMVIERLCANPRIRHPHIMTIVTRRPTRAEALTTVARVPRWFRDAEIRFALASNPYADTGLSHRILPTLNGRQLLRIANAQDLHPSLRRATAFWLRLRDDAQATAPKPQGSPAQDA